MVRLTWGTLGERSYETGVDRGVLYPDVGPGVAWNGLTAVREAPSAGVPDSYYLDGTKYLSVSKPGSFSGSIEAVTYPDEFSEYDGWSSTIQGLSLGGQRQRSFGFCYRTLVGNAASGTDHAYKIHIVYQAMVVPADRDYNTLSDTPEFSPFRWDFTTTPMPIVGRRPLANVVIESSKTHPELLATIEDILYGSTTSAPRLPPLQELYDLFYEFVSSEDLTITNNENGSFTAEGNSVSPSGDTYSVTSPPAVNNGDGTFTM